MRRLIYAWNYAEWGGAQIHFMALIKEARKSFDVVVVLPKGTDHHFLGFLTTEDIDFREFLGNIDLKPSSGIVSKIRRHWIRAKSEYAMLRKIETVGIRDSIIHTDLLPAQSLLALVWLCLRAHVFITLHNAQPMVPGWRWLIWRLKFKIISLFPNINIFCTNEHAAQYYRKLFSGRTGRDIRITYDSINPEEIGSAQHSSFDREHILRKHGISDNKFVVLSVGQFVDRKGRWTMLDAAKAIVKQTNAIVFIWVSPFLPDDQDKRKLKEYQLGNQFHLLRSQDIGQSRQQLLQFYRVADIFALPSYIEGIPIALLESMAMGLPSISTNVYGIPEALINEQTGLLVEAGDPTALAEAILRLFSDCLLRRRISDRGRSYVINKFDERVAAGIAIDAYSSAAQSWQ